jgi:hypothetical protein
MTPTRRKIPDPRFLLLQQAKAAYFRGHWVSSLTRFQAAQALWPPPIDDVDPGLRNELEVELLTLGPGSAVARQSRGDPGTLASHAIGTGSLDAGDG